MQLEVVLPEFVRELAVPPGAPRSGPLSVSARDMDELRTVFQSDYPLAAERLWDDEGRMRRNVIVVRNDELLPHRSCDSTTFTSGDQVVFLMQFAGG